MAVRLEDANLCVRDTEVMIHFLQTAFPEFRVRGEGISNDGTRWVHVGTDETYIALGQARVDPAKRNGLMLSTCRGLLMEFPPELEAVEGAKNLRDWFGYWPNFHDAEVISLHLNRSAISKTTTL
jgi:hypothetical protein